jgi:hypothetical protein
MSDTTSDTRETSTTSPTGETSPTSAASDPLLAALRLLPSHAMEGGPESRLQRQARAAYARSFEPSPWSSSVAGLAGKAAVPVFLAGIVGLYMTWAFAAATALLH